jgi:hypothetical protein
MRVQQSLRFANDASRLFNNDVARLLAVRNVFGTNGRRFESR